LKASESKGATIETVVAMVIACKNSMDDGKVGLKFDVASVVAATEATVGFNIKKIAILLVSDGSESGGGASAENVVVIAGKFVSDVVIEAAWKFVTDVMIDAAW